MNFYTALELLETARNKSAGKPIGRNTRLIWIDEHTIGLTLHDNIIIRYHHDMAITLDSCGWQTVTTKARLNEYTPFVIYSKAKQWYVDASDGLSLPFKDGMILCQDDSGKWSSQNGFTNDELSEKRKLQKSIDKFADKFADALPVPSPSSGDCWYCLMVNEDGNTMGDLSGGHDHLMSHIEEEYFVPALLLNAVKEAGWTDFGIYSSGIFSSNRRIPHNTGIDIRKWHRAQAKKVLKKYLFARIIHNRKVVA